MQLCEIFNENYRIYEPIPMNNINVILEFRFETRFPFSRNNNKQIKYKNKVTHEFHAEMFFKIHSSF